MRTHDRSQQAEEVTRLRPLLNSESHPKARCTAWTRDARTLLSVFAVASIGLLSACGGSDDSAERDDGENTQPEAPTDDGETEADTDTGGMLFDPAVVRTCLADAGYETVSRSEMLSEQQVQDLRTAFGETEGLTFDASTVGFAGGVTFFETPELAAARAQDFADVAKAQRVIGSAMILVEAGSDFDDAVAAAEACLTQ